jgi:hypothetical protein
MSQPAEPRNPFYLLLLIVSVLFVATALGYGVVPLLEENAARAGEPPPPSPFREALATHGWEWLFWELGAMTVLAVLSMGLDRLRSLQQQPPQATIPPSPGDGKSP